MIEIKNKFGKIICTVQGSTLSGIDLKREILEDANLSGADLRGTDLLWATLRLANLTGANLSGANLKRADLMGADLSRADLRFANLTEVTLKGANFGKYGIVQESKHYKGMGSEKRLLTVIITDKTTLYHTGCFFGNAEKFVRAVKKKHGDNEYAKAYLKIVKETQKTRKPKSLSARFLHLFCK